MAHDCNPSPFRKPEPRKKADLYATVSAETGDESCPALRTRRLGNLPAVISTDTRARYVSILGHKASCETIARGESPFPISVF